MSDTSDRAGASDAQKTSPYSEWKYSGIAFALVTALLMSLGDIYVKKAEILNAAELTTVRYLVQTVAMFVLAQQKGQDLSGPRSHRTALLMRGLFGSLNLICFNYSLKLINPSDATALVHCNVVFVAILACVFLHETFHTIHYVALTVTLAGQCLPMETFFSFFPMNHIHCFMKVFTF